jgi:hypothetical protein
LRRSFATSPRFICLLPGGLLIALSLAAISPAYLNHDAAWYLHMAGVWLDGGTLYRDVIDTNPPLIVFLTTAPVWAARLLHLAEPAMFKASVLLAAGGITLVSIPSIRRTWEAESTRCLFLTMVVFLILPFVRGDFGQREHVAVLMVLPFVLTTCSYINGRPGSEIADVVAGCLAGLGFAMKPHFVLAWFALELTLVLLRPSSRTWARPALVSAAVAMILYGAIVLVFVPHYFPIAREVMQVYGGLNSSSATLLRLPDLRLWTIALLVLLLVRVPASQRGACLVLFAVATGFLAAAMLQLKGWGYHLYPFRVFVVLYLAATVASIVDAHPTIVDIIRGGRQSLNAAVVAAVMIWSVRYVAEARRPVTTDYVRLLAAVVNQKHAESLAVLSMRTIVYPAFPVVNYTGARWVMRHDSLWFLPGLYVDELNRNDAAVAFRRPDAMPDLEHQYYEQIIGDLCKTPPRLLVIEPPIPDAPIGGRSLDLIGYYRQDPRFDHLFGAYSAAATIGPFVVYSRAANASCTEAEARTRAMSQPFVRLR